MRFSTIAFALAAAAVASAANVTVIVGDQNMVGVGSMPHLLSDLTRHL